MPATLNGGGGNDRLQDFSPVGRTLDGGGDSDVLEGAGGDDTLRGGPRVACPAACTIVADLRTDRALARKLRLPRSRKLAGARKALRAKGSATLTLKVAPKAKRRFKRLRKATGDPAGADDRRRREDDDGHAEAEAQAVS